LRFSGSRERGLTRERFGNDGNGAAHQPQWLTSAVRLTDADDWSNETLPRVRSGKPHPPQVHTISWQRVRPANEQRAVTRRQVRHV
jgi:hypothetical protein